jgi:hypothetical protein
MLCPYKTNCELHVSDRAAAMRRISVLLRVFSATGGDMPFIRGRYYINPVMGEALEAAREAEAALQALEHIARQKAGDGDDESADSAQASKGPVHRVEIEAAEMVPAHSGRAQRGYAMRIHRVPQADSQADADSDSEGSASDYGSRVGGANGFPSRGFAPSQSDTHIFSNHNDLLDFLRDELASR